MRYVTDTTHPLHTYSEVGVYDDAYYKCKWQCPLDKLIVTEPDYANDIWDYVVREGTCILVPKCHYVSTWDV